MAQPHSLLQAVRERVLLLDGAMGTQLQAVGLRPEQCGEAWNLQERDKVLGIHRRYVEAGADALITNSFGASSYGLAHRGFADQAYAINRASAEIAREAIGPDGWVLGDVGPFGHFLQPLGEMTAERLLTIFTEQIRGLLDGGVDAILLETHTALEEAEIAVRAARDQGAPCIIVSFAYNKGGGSYRSIMGAAPADVVARLDPLGVEIYGANCGTHLTVEDHAEIVKAYRAATDKPIIAQPNAGQPQMEGGCLTYLETPEKMAERIGRLVEAGARLVGGCCGTTPDHIRAFRKVLDQYSSVRVQ
ncbi:MAG TPA: homocysteine S-methyltransferase family protein [Candidatus Sumerlaeota bacterium]|nr:homocysteine S-methyltransferase family protein [Candidatus Sumerlaeota bacterium]HPK03496.1 homocysteine S-methyltransferase family protein [Candidatus Sumerlaeota bacterium]